VKKDLTGREKSCIFAKCFSNNFFIQAQGLAMKHRDRKIRTIPPHSFPPDRSGLALRSTLLAGVYC
jgi:hypothetical protein